MQFLQELGIQGHNSGSSTGINWFDNPGQILDSFSPVDGKRIASVSVSTKENYDQIVQKAQEAFAIWKTWPAPKRGEVVRQVGEASSGKKACPWQSCQLRNGKEFAGRPGGSSGND